MQMLWEYMVGGENGFTAIGQKIAGYIMYFAEAFALGMLMITGIKFVMSAPEGKADAKKRLIPWAIGVVLLFSLNALLDQVADIGSQIN